MKRNQTILLALCGLAVAAALLVGMLTPRTLSPDAPEPTATAAPTARPTATPTPKPAGDAPEPTASPTAVPMEYLYDITVHPPTCQTNGYSVYVNKETGGIVIRDEVSKLPHQWVEDDNREICAVCGTKRTKMN